MKTRMERYKEYRDSISNNIDENIETKDLSSFANRLNKIDNEKFKSMETPEKEEYVPERVKDVELDMYETFENEYLKDFLDEVKSYNIEKGHRAVEDTEQNILHELNLEPEVKEFDIYDEFIEFEKEITEKPQATISDLEKEMEAFANNPIYETREEELHALFADIENINNDTSDTVEEPLLNDFDTNALIDKLEEENFFEEIYEEDEIKALLSDDDFLIPQEPVVFTETDEIALESIMELDDNLEDTKELYLKEDLESIEEKLETTEEEHVEDIIEEDIIGLVEEETIDEIIPKVIDEIINEKEIRKYRLVNGLLTVLLAGVFLAIALAVRFFLL